MNLSFSQLFRANLNRHLMSGKPVQFVYLGRLQRKAMEDQAIPDGVRIFSVKGNPPENCDAEYMGQKIIYCQRDDWFQIQ